MCLDLHFKSALLFLICIVLTTNIESATSGHRLGGVISPSKLDDNAIDFFSYFHFLRFVQRVDIGTPVQSVNMLFSTYYSDNWSFSSSCKSTGCIGHSTYNHSASTSASSKKGRRVIPFSTGNLLGDTYGDVFGVAGLGESEQIVSEMSTVPPEVFRKVNFDGVVGIARKSQGHSNTFVDNLAEQKLIKERKFALYRKNNQYKVVIGRYPLEDIDGELTFMAPEHKDAQHWDFHLDGLQVKDKGVQVDGGKAKIMSSSAFIVGPQDQIDQINLALLAAPNSQGVYFFPSCNHVLMPNVTIIIGGRQFFIEPQDYIIKIKRSYCISAFATMRDLDFWLIGQPVVGPIMTTFDVETGQVGFGVVKKI